MDIFFYLYKINGIRFLSETEFQLTDGDKVVYASQFTERYYNRFIRGVEILGLLILETRVKRFLYIGVRNAELVFLLYPCRLEEL